MMTFSATTQNLQDIADRLKTKCNIAENAPLSQKECKPHVDLAIEGGRATVFLINIAEENRDNIEGIAKGQTDLGKKMDNVLRMQEEISGRLLAGAVTTERVENLEERINNLPDDAKIERLFKLVGDRKTDHQHATNGLLVQIKGKPIIESSGTSALIIAAGLAVAAIVGVVLYLLPGAEKPTPRHHIEQPATSTVKTP